jgi:hypothetical protein
VDIISINYIFIILQSTNFPKTRIVSESYLKRMGKGRREKSGIDLDGITVLGVMRASREVTELTRKKRKNANLGKAQLLYAMTKSRPEAKIVNSIQNSGMILSNSKTLYFSKVLCIFRYFDHRKIQLAYCGKIEYICIFAFLFKLTKKLSRFQTQTL